ncbi:MAG: hypothetical protein IJL51_07980 [Oscillospiraceae bacterium]|nr:hypothetical protein [Oscillospiraceae bacterium]
MADYVVSDASLASVANAIRSKGGTSEGLVFPAGFVSAIDALKTSGWVKTLTAAVDQTGRVFTTDELDDLRPLLTVTAAYEDGTSEAVENYELSGTLTAGTSTIVVSYGDKATVCSVAVTEAEDITPSLGSDSLTAITPNRTAYKLYDADKTLFVYTASNGTYVGMQTPLFSVEEGYGYRLSASVEYFEGDLTLGFRNSNNTAFLKTGIKQESGDYVVDGVLSDFAQCTDMIRLFFAVTWNESKAGRAVFRNIRLIKYATAAPADALQLLMGGQSV